MKKLLTAAAVMVGMVITSSAVSVDWSSGTISFGSEVLKKASVDSYVVYLSSGSYSTYTIDDSFAASDVGSVVSTADSTAKGGYSFGTYAFDYGTKVNGDAFGLVISYNDGTDTWWNLSSVVNTLGGISDATSIPTDWNDFEFASAKTEGTTLSSGGGWVKAKAADPIIPDTPEPATGALALAGIALLFRRRRA